MIIFFVAFSSVVIGCSVLYSLFLRYQTQPVYYGTLPLEAILFCGGVGLALGGVVVLLKIFLKSGKS